MGSGVTRTLFVGIGAMGAPMARNLAKSTDGLVLCDVDTDRASALATEVGASATTNAAELAREADTVILVLPNSSIVESVLDGEGGVLAALPGGALVIDMSSSAPPSTVGLAERAASRGIAFVDAPVSGGVARAVTGDLAIMVGGDEADVARAMPILESMGSVIVPTGRVGTAHAMKALNNLLSATGLAAASEVLAIGTKFGLEPSRMLEILNASSGRNHATEVKMAPFVLSGKFDAGFSLHLMVKDLLIALGIAHDHNVSAPISAAVFETWSGARSMLGLDPHDHTEVAKFVERNAGVELRATAAERPEGPAA